MDTNFKEPFVGKSFHTIYFDRVLLSFNSSHNFCTSFSTYIYILCLCLPAYFFLKIQTQTKKKHTKPLQKKKNPQKSKWVGKIRIRQKVTKKQNKIHRQE